MFSARLFLLLLPSACVCLVALQTEKPSPAPGQGQLTLPEKGEGTDKSTMTTTATLTTITSDPKDSLAEALRVLRRRKRNASGAHRPYSAYRPLGPHRYRYPLYRKRSDYLSPDYIAEDEESFIPLDYDDMSNTLDAEKYSPFRERERGPSTKLISNAHFSNNPSFFKRTSSYSHHLPSSSMLRTPLFKQEDIPYDLKTIGRMYERGKRAQNTPTRRRDSDPSSRGPFRETNEVDFDDYRFPDDSEEGTYEDLIRSGDEGFGSIPESVIRRKRASTASQTKPKPSALNDSDKNRTLEFDINNVPSVHLNKQYGRQKRAYKNSPIFLNPKQEAENDFLTREYFKTIARSVGNKRKRMAFAQFEAKKRSRLDAFLENPQMLHFVQDQIKDAEEEVAKDTEQELEDHPSEDPQNDMTSQALLSNSIARLDALERMREALYQLERLQEQESIQKRAQSLVGGLEGEEENEKEKRRKALKERLMKEGQLEEEEERQKRKEEALRGFLKGNKMDDCPVLERIVMNCLAVTEMVSDDDMVFMEPCLRHEVCYMCGSGLDVSRHECDALFSSALEAGCRDVSAASGLANGSPDCLSAAGTTFNLLDDPSRYDDKGTCTFDPCVRQILDSR